MHYNFWSKKRNIHFGYYKFGRSLRLEAMLEAMNDLLAKSLHLSDSPTNLLDLGCGFGSTAVHIHQKFPKVNITGVNLLASQIAVAEHETGQGKLQFLEADFQAIPLPDAHFDAAYALESACYASGNNKAKLIAEVARLLKADSRFAVVDGFRKQEGKLPTFIDILYKRSLRTWGIPALATIEGFCETLKQYGFEETKQQDISWNMLPSLLHIPFIVAKLCYANFLEKDTDRSRYIQALSLTLALAPFKRYFGYYLVTCVKKKSNSS